MKAKKIEFPSSPWVLLLLVLTLLIWGSFDKIYANERLVLNKPANDIFNISKTQSTQNFTLDTLDIQENITAEATIRDEIKAEAYAREMEAQRLALEEIARIEAEEAARIASEESRYHEVSICPIASSRKNYMDYRALWSGSTQMQIINTYTSVSEDGFLVTEDGFYGVALGSSFGPLGSKYRFTTDNGNVFKVIKVDEKSDSHTNDGCADTSGSIIEFVFDTQTIGSHYPQVLMSGDVNSLSTFNGVVVKAEIYQ